MNGLESIIPNELFELAELFPQESPLYIVGGFVRDYIDSKKESADIDITSALTPDELSVILQKSKFKLTGASPRLGTMIVKGDRSYEYTAFRIDSYPVGNGVHAPNFVEFTKDIVKDAKRRDFKCNAIYFDIKKKKIIDPLCGCKDVENKILNAVIDPNIVLSQDGLRILRLIRMVSTLGYRVGEETLEAAKNLVLRLKDISVERIQAELVKILDGDHVYKALCLMRELKVIDIILPDLAKGNGMQQNTKYHKYDVLEHTFKTVEAAPKEIRLAALFHDIGKPACYEKDGNTYRHDIVGGELTRKILNYYRFPKDVIEFNVELVEAHMFDVAGMAKKSTIRKFISKHPDNIEYIVALQKADGIGTGLVSGPLRESNVMAQVVEMRNKKIPFKISQLKFNGDDLKPCGFKGKEIGNMLNLIFEACLREEIENNKEDIKKFVEKRRKINANSSIGC